MDTLNFEPVLKPALSMATPAVQVTMLQITSGVRMAASPSLMTLVIAAQIFKAKLNLGCRLA